ncbi:MAG: hypothetical protein WCF67_14030, partial [Chitinophagaceae bacterium]
LLTKFINIVNNTNAGYKFSQLQVRRIFPVIGRAANSRMKKYRDLPYCTGIRITYFQHQALLNSILTC